MVESRQRPGPVPNAYLQARYRAEPAVAVLLLGLAAPALLALGMWVLAVDGVPVLFRQERLLPDGSCFALLKVRTYRRDHRLRDEALREDGTLASYDEDPDLLPGARWVRRLGLDELPQLLNIARGQMSFIGPRPLPPHLADTQRQRQPVRVGVLGLAQARTRRDLGLADRLELDNVYAATASARVDAAIAARSLWLVLRGTP